MNLCTKYKIKILKAYCKYGKQIVFLKSRSFGCSFTPHVMFTGSFQG